MLVSNLTKSIIFLAIVERCAIIGPMSRSSRIPQMSALRAFEATVRHGSVNGAAKELNLTDGAVSRAVRELEADVGFSLFQRANRSVIPTSVAHALAGDIQIALQGLATSFERARRQGGRPHPVTLSCEPTFLIRWLIPRLASLQEVVGEREIRLVSGGGPLDLRRENIDLAIRRSDFQLSRDVLAEPFLDESIGPVCSPLHAKVRSTSKLEGSILHTGTRPNAWATWEKGVGKTARPSQERKFEHFYQSLQAAAAGMGLAIGPIALVADDLEAGILTAPWGFFRDGTKYVLMQQATESDLTLYRGVLNWLSAECALLGERAVSD